MQTEHFAASIWFEWWWATIAIADHKVNNRQKHAATFQTGRIALTPEVYFQNVHLRARVGNPRTYSGWNSG